MATATVGSIQEFQPGAETISSYLERLQAYLDANDVVAAKRSSSLVSTTGPITYSVLRSLLAPDTPQSKPYKTLVDVLKKHYESQPLVIAERFYRSSSDTYYRHLWHRKLGNYSQSKHMHLY